MSLSGSNEIYFVIAVVYLCLVIPFELFYMYRYYSQRLHPVIAVRVPALVFVTDVQMLVQTVTTMCIVIVMAFDGLVILFYTSLSVRFLFFLSPFFLLSSNPPRLLFFTCFPRFLRSCLSDLVC